MGFGCERECSLGQHILKKGIGVSMNTFTQAHDESELRILRTLMPLMAAGADLLPFLYLATASAWQNSPAFVTVICSLAPPVAGLSILLLLMYLRLRRFPLNFDGVRIALPLAILGVVLPLFYWI